MIKKAKPVMEDSKCPVYHPKNEKIYKMVFWYKDIIAERKEWEAEVEKQKARADEAEDMIKHWKGAYELYYDEWLKEKKRAEKAEAKLKWIRNTHQIGATCKDGECATCGVIDCPSGEPFHYHHDGCPACEQLMGAVVCPAYEEYKKMEGKQLTEEGKVK